MPIIFIGKCVKVGIDYPNSSIYKADATQDNNKELLLIKI